MSRPSQVKMAMEKTFQVSPSQVLGIHKVLSSKVCVRIFEKLKQNGSLGVSAASTHARCSMPRASALLKLLAELGVATEERYASQRTYVIKNCELTELLSETISLMRGESRNG